MKRLSLFTAMIIGLTSFAQVQVTNGLVAHWMLNKNVNDNTGNGFNGTMHNSPSFASDRNNVDSFCFSSDGNNRLVRFGDILDSVFT